MKHSKRKNHCPENRRRLVGEGLERRELLSAGSTDQVFFVDDALELNVEDISGGRFNLVLVGDFNGNRTDELFFWNSVTGENEAVFFVNGELTISDGSVPTIATSLIDRGRYNYVRPGNFDGVEGDDLFFWNAATGENIIVSFASAQVTVSRNPVEPSLIGNGQFNFIVAANLNREFSQFKFTVPFPDIEDELFLWNNQTGENITLSFTSDGVDWQRDQIHPLAINNGDFTHVVPGDFNRTAGDDLFFWNDQTGYNVTFYFIAGDVVRKIEEIGRVGINHGMFDTIWAGDLDGDPGDEIIFVHSVTGENRTADWKPSGFEVRKREVSKLAGNEGRFNHFVAGDFEVGRGTVNDFFFWNSSTGQIRTVKHGEPEIVIF